MGVSPHTYSRQVVENLQYIYILRQTVSYSGLMTHERAVSGGTMQSFQVDGPQNRQIFLFNENTIGIFLRELFWAEKWSATAAIV